MKTTVLKRIYFVRHGKTESNALARSQLPETPLSEEGRRQANRVAEKFSRIPIDAVVSSPYRRAKETAEAIAQILEKEIVFHEAFRELRRPTEVAGMSFTSDEYLRAINEIERGELDANARHSDEETLFEMEERARQAISFLRDCDGENILAVTHTIFLKMLIAVMTTDDAMSAVVLFRELRYFMEIGHTGITVIEYGQELRGGLRFRLRVLNDRAHVE